MTRTQFAALLMVCAVMSLGGSFGAVFLLQGGDVEAQGSEDPKVLRAQKFELVDGKGRGRGLRRHPRAERWWTAPPGWS